MTTAALAGFGLLYALWVFYLAVMNLMRARIAGRLRKPALVLGYPLLVVGVLLDVAANVLVMSVLLLEPPRELLVTKRLRRHATGTGWRRDVAMWFAVNLLDVFDPSGRHV